MKWDVVPGDGSWSARIRRALTPSGSPTIDGLRLAIINSAILFGAFVLAGLVSVSRALFGWLFPVPILMFTVLTIITIFLAFTYVWYRFAAAHSDAAQRRGSAVNADLIGVIAAAPFIVIAVMLVASGLMALFFGLISFSSGRVGSAVLRIFYAGFFIGLAVVNVIVVRVTTSR